MLIKCIFNVSYIEGILMLDLFLNYKCSNAKLPELKVSHYDQTRSVDTCQEVNQLQLCDNESKFDLLVINLL